MDLNGYCYKVILIALILILALTACQTTSKCRMTKEEESDLKLLIGMLPIAEGRKRYELCQKIINEYNECALTQLSKSIDDYNAEIRSGAIYCINKIYLASKSPKVYDYVPILMRHLQDPSAAVQLETATLLCVLKDYRGVPFLIAALKNKDRLFRMNAAIILSETFNMTFSYKYNASPEEREKSVNKWEEWWTQNKDKYVQTS